ncbi:MAG: Ig-like domain-containing protein [Actinomycetota bacterium]
MTRNALLVLAAMAMAGCGGSSSNKNTVAVVSLSPASVSIVSGQVAQLTVSASDSSANPVPTTFTFNSSNPNLITIAPSGQVCGGVWDSTFVVCNGNDASGNPLTGTATVTATAAGISSPPITVSIHPSVTSITVSAAPLTGANPCVSHGQTQQFTAQAFHNSTDITNLIGQFSWISSNAIVARIDSNGLATANSPGLAGIVATVGGVNSQSIPFNTCMPQSITLHLSSDPAGTVTKSALMNVNDKRTLEADMVDINGTAVPSAPVTIANNNPAVASLAGTTLTGATSGAAGLSAVCAPPQCGAGINQPVYSNLFSVFVNGGSPATTVYVGTTTIPAPGTSPAIVPIDTSKSPPAAGTPIILPGAPTSMGFSGDGTKFYVDTSSGLVSVDPFTNVPTLVDADAIGVILAVSPDGTKVIISNVKFQADVPSQRIFIFDASNRTLQTFILPGAVAAAFDNDGFKAYIAANFVDPATNTPQARIYVWSPVLTLRTLAATGTPSSVTAIASGPLTYVANGSTINAVNVCDNSFGTDVATNTAPQLLGSPKNTNTVVAVDQHGVDIVHVLLADATVGQCPSPVTYATVFEDFGVPITARKLLVATPGNEFVVLAAGLNKIGVAHSGGAQLIPFAGSGTEAVAGDLTQDGNTLWVGIAGTNDVHEINLPSGTDQFQIQLNLNSTNAVPDLIAVRPK